MQKSKVLMPAQSAAIVTPVGVRQQVYDFLRQGIIEMRIPPGKRLIERELVEMTSASRSSVREAIRQLEMDGLVRSIPRNRVVVAIPTAQEASELYEVRGLLESLAVRKFTEGASEAEHAALERAFSMYESAEDVSARLQAKNDLYSILGSHVPSVHEILARLNARVALMRTLSLSSPGRHKDSVEEIRALMGAIRDRDADRAANLCLRHAEKAREVVLEILERSPWLSDLHHE
jgi:DNA-binding GntR family transcriptional regulator